MPSRRAQDRPTDALRPLAFDLDPLKFAEGSALISLGDTRVLVSASVERRVPPFVDEARRGWVTAEYAMLPRATQTRSTREVSRGRPSGRSSEIQRLVGRSLRSVVDLEAIPGHTATVDCDVIQADGGTRTASITAAYVALARAFARLMLTGDITAWPFRSEVAAVSVGMVGGQPLLDLDYPEDSEAEVDLNVVGTGSGELVEIQGTGERRSFTRGELDTLVDLAFSGLEAIFAEQRRVLAETLAEVESVRDRPRRRTAPKDERQLWGRP